MNLVKLPCSLSSMQDACQIETQLNDLALLAVCRTPVTYELSRMTLLSMSSHCSVDKAPAQCSGGHGLNYCWELRFFVCPTLVSCWSICKPLGNCWEKLLVKRKFEIDLRKSFARFAEHKNSGFYWVKNNLKTKFFNLFVHMCKILSRL